MTRHIKAAKVLVIEPERITIYLNYEEHATRPPAPIASRIIDVTNEVAVAASFNRVLDALNTPLLPRK